MDAFREQQKKLCGDASPSKGNRPYGCSCCRYISDLGSFKKASRRLAKVRFREETRREIDNQGA